MSDIGEYENLTEDEIDELFEESIILPTRRFKDYCFQLNIIQDWYRFKEKKYKEIAIEWCKQNGLKYKE